MIQARKITQIANRHAAMLLFLGVAAVGAYNWRLWQRDRALAKQLREERRQVPTLSCTPKISALVAAWNEHAHIDAHIRSFLALDYPNIELVLCAGGTDDTLERAKHYVCERVIVLEQYPGEGKQHALARCFEHASGEIMYLTDADCVYDHKALIRLMAPIIEEDEQATTGGSRPLDIQTSKVLPSYLWASDAIAGAQNVLYTEGLLGRNAAITRQAIERTGGLDFNARTGTDYQLARRLVNAGIRIRYVGASIVSTEYPATLRNYQRQQSRWLRNLLIYGRRYGATHDVYVTLKTIITGLLMLLAPLGTIAFGNLVVVLWGLLVLHAMFSKLRYVLFTARLYRHSISTRLLMSIPLLTLADFAIWTLPIVDLLHPGSRERW